MHDTLSSLVERAMIGNHRPLEFYLREHSRLPGPRANLELADDVAYLLANASTQHPDVVRSLITHFTTNDQGTTANNTPTEFILLCGVISAGICSTVQVQWREQIIEMLNRFACSSSWRVREAVASAYQHLLSADPQQTFPHLHRLASEGNFLQQRAAIAAIAEPRLLYKEEMHSDAFRLQRSVLEQVKRVPMAERKNEDFRVLRRALGYTLSVVTAADPEAGFALMRECALWNDDDVVWILRENLKKKRLARFAQDMASVLELL